MKLYCDTCIERGDNNEKCPWCDGWKRKTVKREEIVWVKKGLIWKQQKY